MNILTLSQIILNLAASLAIVLLATLIGIIAYETIKFINGAKKLAKDIKKESAQAYKRLDTFMEAILGLSFVSKLFKKKREPKQNNSKRSLS